MTDAPQDGLLLRATIAFAALPGVVAFALPLVIATTTVRTAGFARAGLVELALGVAVLGWCVRDFYVHGRGTLAPWAPPMTLVRTGLYSWSRNPMYLGVLLIAAGWAIGFRSQPLTVYTAVLAVLFHLRVVFSEEPFLLRTFGDAWAEYRKRVPRWVF
jgi:protein-S-isoprenylcysteine O-methyltransferase Ste14